MSAKNEGYDAYYRNRKCSSNPHEEGTKDHGLWVEGYNDAFSEDLRAQGPCDKLKLDTANWLEPEMGQQP